MPRDEERKREYMREYSRRKRKSEEVRARENEARRRKRQSEEVRARENASRREYYYKYNSPQSENYEEFKARRQVWYAKFYANNKEKLIEDRQKIREEIRDWYIQLKRTLKCMSCGESNPACLHFHHRKKGEKIMNVANYVYQASNLKAVMREVDKCDVLCANCHFIEHWQERDEASDLLEYERLQQELLDTKGWYARMKLKQKIYRLNTVIWFNTYKRSLACNSCGISHPACLQFHHSNPKDKTTEVGNLVGRTTVDRLKREIDKCEVLCANCHAKYHYSDIYWDTVDDV